MLIFGYLYIIIGVIIAALGAITLYLEIKNEQRHTQTAFGYILDNKKIENKYYPLIAYEIGTTNLTTQYKIGTKKICYEPKSTVTLGVNPEDMTDIIVINERLLNNKNISWCQIIIGSIVIASGILNLIA